MDGRWRGGGDGDGDDLPFNPRPDKVPEQELLVPKLGFEEAAALCIFSGKTIGGSGVFRSKGINRRKGVASRATTWPGGTQARPTLGRGQVVSGGCGWPRSHPSGSVGLLQKYNFWNFSRFFREL